MTRVIDDRQLWREVAATDTYSAQAPYRNGVTIWRRSWWLGNGFGQEVDLVAVGPNGIVIGRYHNDRYSTSSWVRYPDIDLNPEYEGTPPRRRTVVSRYLKWIRAIKTLEVAQVGRAQPVIARE